jgi:hypothetical protein
MKKLIFLLLIATTLGFYWTDATAESQRLHYKMAPGQTWVAVMSTQNEFTVMGNKDVHRNKINFDYSISKGPKPEWVSLTGKITFMSGDEGGEQMDMSKLSFFAEMHSSGEIQNISYEGSVLPAMGAEAGEIPPEIAAMYEGFTEMIAQAWVNSVFWFPELPDYALEIGDEFEVTQKFQIGSEAGGVEVNTVSKQVFTLEDLSEGLAYFTVKERAVTKSSSAMGGNSDTKTAGKGEAIFDLREGMWLELTTRSMSRVELGNMQGVGDESQDILQITKVRVSKK